MDLYLLSHKKINRLVMMWLGLLSSIGFPFTAMSNTIINTVPFENNNMAPNDIIQASYSFGSFSVIFCYENNQQTVGIIQWPLQGIIQNSTLPISLITNGQFQGSFADAIGTITIINNASVPLVVSCYFAY